MALKPRGMIAEDDPRVAQVGHPAPPWMVNYADLMTELVCFYLILYAVASSLSKPMQQARRDIEESMKNQEVAGNVTINKEGLIISLQEQGSKVFFRSGSAELSEDMKKILDGLGPTFKSMAEKDHDMIVEGHTDDVPVHSNLFPSNWELSTARATNVVQYLLRTQNYPPKHIAAIGYGDNKSLDRTPEEDLVAWRSKNRRVVFVLKGDPSKGASDAPVATISDGKTKPVAATPETGEAVSDTKP